MAETAISSSGVVTFRPKARLLLTLGEEHISRETVALIELVKNAYDADATRILVRFHGPLERGKGALEVIDNGHGMSLETVQSTWMELATTSKKRKVRSEQRKRRVLGEKGIGRLATSRLAHTLELITRRADQPHEIQACFDWNQFDDEEKFLDEVDILWRSSQPSQIGPRGLMSSFGIDENDPQSHNATSGTILRMSGLKQTWGQQQVEAVRYGLARLISPFCAQKRTDDFQIRLELPSPFERLSGPIEPPAVLRNPHCSLKGYVSQTGHYNFTITLRQQEQAEQIEQIEQITGQFSLKDNRPPQCGPFHLELRAWDRDSLSIAERPPKYGSTINNFRRDLDEAAGISIYRDGFRVLPYGEAGNDWLGLDSRRAQNPKLRLAHNQIVGHILISADKNRQLRDQSNREGLIEGPALHDLREMIRMGLTELEIQRYTVRHPNQEKKAQASTLFTDLNLATIRDLIKQRYPNDTELLTLVGQQEKALKPQLKEAQQAQQVLGRYRRLATLGLLILTLIHDGRAPVTHIRNQIFLANRDVRRTQRKNGQLVQRLVQRLDTIDKQAKKISNFFNKLKPFGGRYARRLVRVRLEDVIVEAFAVMETEISRNQVRVCLPQSYTWITVEPTEIQQIIVNLLQNSLYALSNLPKDERRIIVQVHRTRSEEVQIIFSDSGPGVSPSVRERIFEAYYSTKPAGMGLGLAIVGDLVSEYYNGNLELVEGGPLPGATFRITLRKGVKDE